ncbi:hypothetical protein WICPIJ_008066 [Wickerhamomyces pijperi]|uniref:RNA helicase n=1 Tax=Wickerhamomyces pijperi TaxID=599730 RepID=A0A9P8TIJ5_WICPI|nr:hypothetical protein WICPIJ_008066 [Wickerhamomyces pijperi]
MNSSFLGSGLSMKSCLMISGSFELRSILVVVAYLEMTFLVERQPISSAVRSLTSFSSGRTSKSHFEESDPLLDSCPFSDATWYFASPPLSFISNWILRRRQNSCGMDVSLATERSSSSVGSSSTVPKQDMGSKSFTPFKTKASGSKGNSKSNRVSKAKKASKNGTKVPKDPKLVESSSLKWKSVDIPDTLEDFGGFYGLEEIDGVGVEYVDGKVKFVVKDENKIAEPESIKQDEEAEEEEAETNEEQESSLSTATLEDGQSEDEPMEAEEDEEEDEDMEEQEPEQEPEQSNAASFDSVKLGKDVDLPSWAKCGLSQNTLQGLSKLGFNKPTPIQSKTIPLCKEGKDIIGKASTGSGKTLAYGIPILEKLVANGIGRGTTGVIFTPTRELAHQVVDHLTSISTFFPFHKSSVLSITGGLSIQKQERLMKYDGSAQIIVATPGRFLEFIEKNSELAKRIADLDILVLDEADRLLQDGHFEEFEQILKVLKTARSRQEKWQTLIFSATFSRDLFSKLGNTSYKPKAKTESIEEENKEIIKLLDEKVHFKSKPEFIDLNPHGKLHSDIIEALVECLPIERDLYLYYFLLMYPGTTLVFTNAIDSVKRLVNLLNNVNISTFAIHSNMIQKQRLKSIEKFSEAAKLNTNKNKSTVLIASDVAARGLDIKGIQHVVHYHLPRSADVYIHRSGRTARSGTEGVSVMICSPQEASGPLRNLRKALSNDKTKYRGKSSRSWTKEVQRLPIESDIVAQLKERVQLAGELADNEVSTKSLSKETNWMKQAAEDLGIDDLSDMEEDQILKRSRTKKENKQLSKQDVSKKKFELKTLLQQNIKKDLRRSYLTGGLQNLADSIIKGVGHGNIIGHDKVDALKQLKPNKKK